ncbi:MAG: choice-of-anchor D domain-containing protein [Saprospiraceae bacterium]|nr:choice-of-anchor D domain-containing protein [Saprospiraceae bacterium]
MTQMISRRTLYFAIGLLCCINLSRAYGQDVILQGFYWNTHPGDVTNTTNGGIWWDTLTLVAPQLKAAGFSTVWTPPPTKSFAGVWDMGYGLYDYFDLGTYNSKGTIRTRHGSREQLDAMISAMHTNGINVMADVVLNHRGGADAQAPYQIGGYGTGYNVFNPPSTRIPSGPEDVHPTIQHPDLNPDYHNRIFFEDVCHFNESDAFPPTNPDGTAGSWFFGAPTICGSHGDSLIMWGRWLINDVGFDELRLDAVKHVDPWFIKKFLIESRNGAQPFAIGESFEYTPSNLVNYWSQVEAPANSGGVKNAKMSLFDFPLRAALKTVLNNGSGTADLYNTLGNAGLVWGTSMGGFDVVTWLESHDTDRTGYIQDGSGCAIPFGGTCLKLHTEPDHDPIILDKEDMGYPFLMAAEGRPVVFWKDWYWFGMSDDVSWQMALRQSTATGTSDHIQNMAGNWPNTAPYDADNNGGNMFALRRNGLSGGVSDGMILGLNDHPSKEGAVWVNTPFTDKYLKDYSDGYLFVTTKASATDTRALIKAQPRDYSWWSVTGLYPKQPGTPTSHFTMAATPGGCPHFIALRAADAPNLIVNGAPIAAGDEVAVKNAAGQVAGIGRIGQSFRWDGTHDMLIEVLGSTGGMTNGESFRIFVFDQSANQEVEIGTVQYAASGVSLTFHPDRPNSPNRNGNFSTFSVTTTAQGSYTCEGISRILAFNTQVAVNQTFCAADQADQPAYGDGWQSGDNGGNGFNSWTLSTTGSAGSFIGNSDIATGGASWGMWANSGGQSNAVRPFVLDWPAGTVFNLKMDNGSINSGGSVGFGLQNASGENLLEFYFNGGATFYTYDDASGPHNTSTGFTTAGLGLKITLQTPTTYELVVSPLSGASSTYTGSLKNPAGGQNVNRLRLFNSNAGSGSANDAFFNSPNICYPPTLVINEVDYDQPGTDNLEFVELKNVSANAVNLDAYTLELIDGSGNNVYATVDLPNVNLAAGDYYVICNNGSALPNCDFSFGGASEQIQNGAPDALRLRINSALTVDALSYEGSVAGAVEGSGAGLDDAGSAQQLGLSRVPDGSDTDVNGTDFVLTCISPGSANLAAADTDSDGIPNACDNCPATANTDQADADNDGLGDVCDPDIDVRGNGIPIVNGDPMPGMADGTDFGAAIAGAGVVTRTFTVHNTGSGSLNLTASPKVQLTGAQAADFSVTTQPASPVTASPASFTIQFEPAGFGTRVANVVIASDDNDENPYTFAIQGEGTPQPQAISVNGNNLPIANRSATVSIANGTDFGTVAVGSTVTHTFTVRNGAYSSNLYLTGVPKVTIADRDAADFNVTVQPGATLGAGGEVSFELSFTPGAAGLRSAIVILTHNDLPDNAFVFTIQGTGL